MAEEKRITISRTLNGDTIYYIARNSTGAVFARELTLEKLQGAIKTYKEPPPEKVEEGKGESVKGEEKPKEKKFLTNKLASAVRKRKKEQEKPRITPSEEPTDEGKNKQFLENELKTKVQERKQQSKKKSFWDKLK